MAAADRDLKAAIAVTRFGLGARPGEIDEAAHDPQGFLKTQIRREGAELPAAPTPETAARRIADLRDYEQQKRMERREVAAVQPVANAASAAPPPADPAKMAETALREDTQGDFLARVQLAATTDAGFRERWALFFANHFTVAAKNMQTAVVVGPYENEAIRPYVFGRFVDLLAAVETHPAMMLYLDQAQSIGPNSQMAEQARFRAARRFQPVANRAPGLNENLAREIMELHTVGVDGGYSQADVTEFARAMTGLSVGGYRAPEGRMGEPVFREVAHEPGTRTIMGVRYSQFGKEQAGAILSDLAAKPQTAHFVCTKLARHFVADDPAPALVARLTRAWTSSGGDLARVAEALIEAPEAWAPAEEKFKTPYDFVVSAHRAAGIAPQGFGQVGPILASLGQKPFDPGSPKGFADDTLSWAAPDGIVKRMQYAQGFAARSVQSRDPKALAAEALGARLSPATALAIARAESRPEGFALLLMSPEFQRR